MSFSIRKIIKVKTKGDEHFKKDTR